MDRLRTKLTNVLLATSVVEEGVDVAACSFVVAFDHMKSTKAYVQMKGRARQKNAKFIVFQNVTPDANIQHIDLRAAQSTSVRVKNFLRSRKRCTSPYFERALNTFLHQEKTSDIEMVSLQLGEYRTKYAFVNISSAKDLFFRYVLSIPNGDYFSGTQDSLPYLPFFERETLILPSHLPSSIRYINLPHTYHNRGIKEKQNMLSFMACVRLHRLGL